MRQNTSSYPGTKGSKRPIETQIQQTLTNQCSLANIRRNNCFRCPRVLVRMVDTIHPVAQLAVTAVDSTDTNPS